MATVAATAVATVVVVTAVVDTEGLPRAVVATTARRLPAPALDTASRSLASRRGPAGRCVFFSFPSPSCSPSASAPRYVPRRRRFRGSGHDEKPLALVMVANQSLLLRFRSPRCSS